jgi:hypothetical protein
MADQSSREGISLKNPKWSSYVAISTAFMAFFAGLASNKSTNFANFSLSRKNESVLYQVQAIDQWSYYQAKGIKGLIYTSQAQTMKDKALLAEFTKEGARYRDEQMKIKAEAEGLEAKVSELNDLSIHLNMRALDLSLAATIMLIGMALSAVALISDQPLLWYLSLAAAADGLFVILRALLSN